MKNQKGHLELEEGVIRVVQELEKSSSGMSSLISLDLEIETKRGGATLKTQEEKGLYLGMTVETTKIITEIKEGKGLDLESLLHSAFN